MNEKQVRKHAAKMAEALRALLEPLGQDEIDECWQYKDAQKALIGWEKANQ